MSTVSSVSSGTNSTASSQNKIIGKDEFLKMLIAQLKNQDPMNPLDGTNFAAQLAQFSTVEQIYNMSTQLGAMSASISAMNNTQMATLIGSEVTAQGSTIKVDGPQNTLTYRLSSDAAKGTIRIFNDKGVQVKALDMVGLKAGMNTLTWDSSGLASGTYTFDVSATDKNGVAVSATTIIIGNVTGVSYKDGTPYITVNGQDIDFGSVISVKKPSA
ncbi:MAG: flagellar hook assembly protein FlgD [Syntrophales bacterium]